MDDTSLLRVSFFGSESEITDPSLQALLQAKGYIVDLNLGRTRIGARAGEVLGQLS